MGLLKKSNGLGLLRYTTGGINEDLNLNLLFAV
jgi:hypothetical protein